ncbi:hypothetical protein N0V90_007889 [Kalmusia sp. IMI 367209]|nr:hypothetical protein N0V90_007889 [Kalmusia sp. IMI 367209]
MADAAIGSVSLAIELCKGLVWYIESARSAKDRLSQVAEDVSNLAVNLELLNSIIKTRPDSPSRDAALAGIISCGKALEKIEKKLGTGTQTDETNFRNHLRVLRQRLVFPFKQGDILFLKNTLEDMKHTLQLVLSMLQLETLNDTNRQVAQLVQSTDSSRCFLREQLKALQHESLRHKFYQNLLLRSTGDEISQRVIEVQAGANDVRNHLQPLALNVSTISTRLSQLEMKLNKMVLTKLDPPSVNKDISNFSDIAQDMMRIRRKIAKTTTPRKRCSCQDQINTTIYFRWPFQLERTQTIIHSPSCQYGPIERTVTSLQMRFDMCSILLGQKVHIAFALSSGAGGTTVSKVVLECTRVVSESSPAFALVRSFYSPAYRESPRYKELSSKFHLTNSDMARLYQWQEVENIKLYQTTVETLAKLFQSGKASPYDKLSNGIPDKSNFPAWAIRKFSIQKRTDAYYWRSWTKTLVDIVTPVIQFPEHSWLINEVIRLILFNRLEIRHTCCDIEAIMWYEEPDYSIRPAPRYDDTEELESIQEEDAPLVELLEELLARFQKWWDDGKRLRGLRRFVTKDVLPEVDRVLKKIHKEDIEEFHKGRWGLGVSMEDTPTEYGSYDSVVESEDETESESEEGDRDVEQNQF